MPNKPRAKHREGESPEPQARGGRRSRHPNSLANLKKWQPGTSGNPSGKSTALNDVIRYARTHSIEALHKLLEIMRSPDTHPRDAIQAALAVLDRGCGKAIVPVFRTGNRLPLEMTVADGEGDGGEYTALLAAAARGPEGAYRRALQAELERLDNEASKEKQTRRDETDRAREALARGEPITPLQRMLIAVKDETS
jgi:hypothetical protein